MGLGEGVGAQQVSYCRTEDEIGGQDLEELREQ